jgi:hypothetical protein
VPAGRPNIGGVARPFVSGYELIVRQDGDESVFGEVETLIGKRLPALTKGTKHRWDAKAGDHQIVIQLVVNELG